MASLINFNLADSKAKKYKSAISGERVGTKYFGISGVTLFNKENVLLNLLVVTLIDYYGFTIVKVEFE